MYILNQFGIFFEKNPHSGKGFYMLQENTSYDSTASLIWAKLLSWLPYF